MRAYFDYNATAPVRPEVRARIEPLLFDSPAQPGGNASSVHWAGQEARRRLEAARSEVAARLGRKPSEVTFTSGGTESDNLALTGILLKKAAKKRLVISSVEHPAVRATAHALRARHGIDVVEIGVDAEGTLDLPALAEALKTPTGLVSVMAVNNETGVMMPIAEVERLTSAAGVPLHVDAVQAAGRVPLPLGADLITLSGHKLGGLTGVGALILGGPIGLESLLHGGPQERGRRAGTEPVALAQSFATALSISLDREGPEAVRLGAERSRIDRAIAALPGARVIGQRGPRVANTTTAVFEGVDGEALLQALDLAGIAASSGSACSSGSLEPSHVLLAMGTTKAEALSAVRFSMGWGTTPAEVDRLLQVLPQALAQVRKP